MGRSKDIKVDSAGNSSINSDSAHSPDMANTLDAKLSIDKSDSREYDQNKDNKKKLEFDEKKFKRPSSNYVDLVSEAINSSPDGKLTVSQIYEWFINKHPFFETCQTNWRNSIRHLLSMNPHFKKIPRSKTESGKGSYWTLESKFLGVTMPFNQNDSGMFSDGTLAMLQANPAYINCVPYIMPGFNDNSRFRINNTNNITSNNANRNQLPNYRPLQTNDFSIPTRPSNIGQTYYGNTQPELNANSTCYDKSQKQIYSQYSHNDVRGQNSHPPSLQNNSYDILKQSGTGHQFTNSQDHNLWSQSAFSLTNGNFVSGTNFNTGSSANQYNNLYNDVLNRTVDGNWKKPNTSDIDQKRVNQNNSPIQNNAQVTNWGHFDLNSLSNANRSSTYANTQNNTNSSSWYDRNDNQTRNNLLYNVPKYNATQHKA